MGDEDVDNVKEVMSAITEVKVSIAELKTEVKQLNAVKETADYARDTANEANTRSLTNEKGIGEIKDNDRKKWGVIVTIGGAFVVQIIYFLMTFGIK